MHSEKKKNRFEIDMCYGSIMNKLISFSIPLMISGILQLAFNAVDIVVVGRFSGSESLAAVGSTTALINVFTNLFIGISLGANVLAARFYAAGREKEMSETVHTAITFAIISGVVMALVGLFFSRGALELMGTPDNVINLSTLYMKIYFLGMPFFMLYNYGAAILRAVGDTKRPLYYLSAAGVINIGLNLLFVIVFRMSVAGVALATVISETISASLVIRCMMKEKGSIRLTPSKLRIHPKRFAEILRIGLPASLQGVIFAISNVIIQSSVNSFGSTVVAGNSAASNIEGFVYVSMNSFYQGTISFTSQNVGAGKYERVNKILFTAQACVIVTGLVLGNLAVFFGPDLLGFYTRSAAVKAAGMNRLKIICTVYALCGIMDVMVGSLRGLRLLWIFRFFRIYERFHTPQSLYLTYPVSWIITICAHVVCFVIVRRRISRRLKTQSMAQ